MTKNVNLKRPQTPLQIAANEKRRAYALSQKRNSDGKFSFGVKAKKFINKINKTRISKETAPVTATELVNMSHPVMNESATLENPKPLKAKKDDFTASFHLQSMKYEARNFSNKFKSFWNKHNQGNKNKILTYLGLSLLLVIFSFLLGRTSAPKGETLFVPVVTPTAGDERNHLLQKSAIGTLIKQNNKFTLEGNNETVLISSPTISLDQYLGKRIAIYGSFDSSNNTLTVSENKYIEIITASVQTTPVLTPIPTEAPSTQNTIIDESNNPYL